jgi:hypothetical protein
MKRGRVQGFEGSRIQVKRSLKKQFKGSLPQANPPVAERGQVTIPAALICFCYLIMKKYAHVKGKKYYIYQ